MAEYTVGGMIDSRSPRWPKDKEPQLAHYRIFNGEEKTSFYVERIRWRGKTKLLDMSRTNNCVIDEINSEVDETADLALFIDRGSLP